MKITGILTKDLAAIIAELVRQGVQFEAWQREDGSWMIELTGAF